MNTIDKLSNFRYLAESNNTTIDWTTANNLTTYTIIVSNTSGQELARRIMQEQADGSITITETIGTEQRQWHLTTTDSNITISEVTT